MTRNYFIRLTAFFLVPGFLCVMALAASAVLYGKEEAPKGVPSTEAGYEQICARVIRCDSQAAQSANFRNDCADFLERSATRFPVQFKSLTYCARRAPCEGMYFAGCIAGFYGAIKLDAAGVLPAPRLPAVQFIPIRKLTEWPAPIPLPTTNQIARLREACDRRAACTIPGQDDSGIDANPEYCMQNLLTVHRVERVQFQIMVDCMGEHPCEAKSMFECIERGVREAEEVVRQTPEYKAAEREVRPYCDRVRECRTPAARGEEFADPTEICTKMLISFRKFPQRFERLTNCLKDEDCDDNLFATCLGRMMKMYEQ